MQRSPTQRDLRKVVFITNEMRTVTQRDAGSTTEAARSHIMCLHRTLCVNPSGYRAVLWTIIADTGATVFNKNATTAAGPLDSQIKEKIAWNTL
jgi:hypothetical protein